MSLEYFPGHEVQRGELDIHFQDADGCPTNVYEISYELFYLDPGPPQTEVPIPPGTPRKPVNPQTGEYYAALFVPPSAVVGDYRIRWTFTLNPGEASQQVVMDFKVVPKCIDVVKYTSAQADCIKKLRVLLRDNNPDRNYHFRPPEHEGRIGAFNRVFGQIWTDEELLCYLEMALDWWNMQAPETEYLCSLDVLIAQKKVWRVPVKWGAAIYALFALAANWIADEFDYSIGGVSLSIEKSSKYQSLKNQAEQHFEKAIETKLQTTKIIAGLQQRRFGLGIRSAFGPHVGRGVLSPRNFL